MLNVTPPPQMLIYIAIKPAEQLVREVVLFNIIRYLTVNKRL